MRSILPSFSHRVSSHIRESAGQLIGVAILALLCLQLVEYRLLLQTTFLVVPSEYRHEESWYVVQLQRRVLFSWLMEVCQLTFGLSRKSFAFGLEWTSITASALLLYRIARQKLGSEMLGHWAAFTLVLIYTLGGVLSKNHAFYYVFDTTSLLIHCIGLTAIALGNVALLAVVVLVGTLNRETTLWLVIAYGLATSPIIFTKASIARTFKSNGAVYLLLIGAWVVPKAILSYIFPGDLAKNQLGYNVAFVFEALAKGKLLRLAEFGAGAGFIPLCLLWHARDVARFVGFWRMSWVLALVFIVLPYSSVLIEARIYIDTLPYLILPALFIYKQNHGGVTLEESPNRLTKLPKLQESKEPGIRS